MRRILGDADRDEIRVERCGGLAALMIGNPVEQNFARNLLPGFPSGEGLGVVHGKKFHPVERHVLQFDGRRETAQQRWHRGRRHIDETEALPQIGERKDTRPDPARRFVFQPGR
jgi:hypothetical protein